MRAIKTHSRSFTLTACFLFGSSALGGTVHVPGDQPTLQAAVDSAISGDEIVVQAGTYTRVMVVNRSRLRIRGVGKVWIEPAVIGSFGVLLDGSTGIVCENIGVRKTTGNGFRVISSSDVLIRDCEAKQVGVGLLALSSTGVVTDDLRVQFASGIGVHIQQCSGSAVVDSRISGCGSYGAFFTLGSRNLIAETSIDEVTRGVYASNESHFLALDNDIERTIENGFSFTGVTSGRVQSNRISDTGANGVSASSCPLGIVVAENRIERVSSNGVLVVSSDGATVESNEIRWAGASGILATQSDDIRIAGNEVDRAEEDGVAIVACDRSHLHDNEVSRAEGTGFSVSNCPDTALVGNREKKSAQGHLVVASANVVLVDNVFSGLPSAPVLSVPKDYASIQLAVNAAQPGDMIVVKKGVYDAFSLVGKTNLVIRGKKGVWIEPQSNATAVSVVNCRGVVIDRIGVRKAPLSGVVVTGSLDVVVDRCKIKSVEDQAIVLKGTALRADRCKIEKAGSPAFQSDAVSGWIRDNHLGGASTMVITGSGSWICGNELKSASTLRMSQGIGSSVVRNKVQGGSSHTLHIENADRTHVLWNQTSGDSQTGLRISSSDDAFAFGNKVAEANSGIVVQWSDTPRLVNNEVDDSQHTGMTIAFADDAMLLRNRVHKAKQAGIDLQSSDRTRWYANRVTSTKRGYVVKYGMDHRLLGNTSKKTSFVDFDAEATSVLTLVANRFKKVLIE